VTAIELRPEGTLQTARLFEAHATRVLAYCQRRLGSRAEAEDALQTVFLYAHRALRRGVVPESEEA
jgi:DNA-directed RNA polymerase specialized sigma24 family protein